MTDSERARHRLLARLREVLGDEEAATLMENLPPRPWSELATKDDIAELRSMIGRIAGTFEGDVGTLKGDVGTLKGDVGTLKGDVATLSSDLAHVSEKLDLRFQAHGDRIEALVRERIDSQTKLLFFSIIGALLTTAAIALGSAAI